MKKATLTAAIVLAFTFNTGVVKAEASKEGNIGFFSGALAGAAVGGPIGFIIGGVAGSLTGEQVHKANQLEKELVKQQDENQMIQQELASIKQDGMQPSSQQVDGSDWITQGLTLNLMFTTNSAALSDTDNHMIERLAGILNEYPELKVRLDGYADPRGDEVTNMKLSETRTKAVEQAFDALGIDASRLTIQAHGETEATNETGDLDAYAMDRRVSVNFFTAEDVSVAQN